MAGRVLPVLPEAGKGRAGHRMVARAGTVMVELADQVALEQ
jgi:hypothetical protein